MHLRRPGSTLAFFASLLLIAFFAAACGGGGGQSSTTLTTGTSANSAVLVNVGDAPLPNLLAFEVTVNSASLTGSTGTVNLITNPIRFEVTSLAGTLRPLMLTNVPAGTYNQLSLTFSNAEAVVLSGGIPTHVNVSVPTAPVTITLNPALTVGSGATALNIDFNLANSLSTDASNNITFNPSITVTAVAVPAGGAGDEDHGKVDDLHGIVSSVAAPQFTITTPQNATGITFTTDSTTVFEGITGISQLAKGLQVEVDAAAQPGGSLLAKKVEVETEDGEQGMDAEGLITQVTGNPATQITLVTHDSSTAMPGVQPALGSTVTVNIGSNTNFRVSDKVDVTGLSFTPTFDATTLAAGQKVEADTDVPAVSTITAKRIKQGIQAIDGTISGLTVNGSRASFTLTLPGNSALATLTNTTTITVFQQPSTEVKGLTVANSANVRVRGALFFNKGTYNLVAQRIVNP